jgi:hypothetical protein
MEFVRDQQIGTRLAIGAEEIVVRLPACSV